jgi:hypothetical protein
MSLTKFLQTIDNSFLGKLIDRKLKVFERTDPERIYIENVRSFYNLPHFAARFFCDMAVKEGLFSKHYGVMCPNENRIIISYSSRKDIPELVKCHNCELLEKDNYAFSPKPKDIIEYYKLKKSS